MFRHRDTVYMQRATGTMFFYLEENRTNQIRTLLQSSLLLICLHDAKNYFSKVLAYSPDADFKVILSKLSISGKVYFINLLSRLDIT